MTEERHFCFDFGCVGIEGADAGEFLNRLGTGVTKDLKTGGLTPTLFLRGDGRLIANALCIREGEDRWVLLCEPAMAAPLREHLDRMHFTEAAIIGPVEELPGCMWYGDESRDGHKGIGYGGLPAVLTLGADMVSGVGTDSEWLDFRIRNLIPDSLHELREPVVPLEANLKYAISFTKGCFPGQEVVARIENLGHPANVLVSMEFDEEVADGADLMAGDKRTGRVTTVQCLSDGCRGLGYVKWAQMQVGTALHVLTGSGNVRALVVANGYEQP